MKKFIVLLVLLVSVSGISQSVNDFQYVIVPTKFTGFKENDKYRLNSTTKMLLEKHGFKVFMSTEDIPNDIGNNCNRLYADLLQDNDFMITKLKLVLKDCKEKVIFETDFGKSREKEYGVAYNQALRETSKSFDKLNYKYNGKNGTANEPATTSTQVETVNSAIAASVNNQETFYFAQPTATGFQIIDAEPKVIMRLFNTSQKDVFIVQKGAINGVLLTKNGQWFFEYYENGKLFSETLQLKF
ncbi:hypothetical protein [Flavobacterium sp. 25HG05S-40]|uniref:hypothetical protein n=1 Tax=Flavobacterium sp. 25HG05S-40 TaxID=3458682 RepID=UPI004044B052